MTKRIRKKDLLSGSEMGVLLFIVMITFKTCNLPSVLFSEAKESGVWSIIFHLVLDAILLVFALYIASLGGIQSKTIPAPVRKIASALLFVFFLFKFTAFSFEATSSTVSVLFENSLIFPIFIAILISTAFLGGKGFTSVGRTALLLAWLALLLLVFNILFISFDGFGFNLYPILRFEKVTSGMLKEAIWFGEPLILMTADLSPKLDKKQKGFVISSYVVSCVILIGFYLLLIFTYGDVSKSVNNAFSRVLTMNKFSNQLGAVDWPIIALWLGASIIHLSCLFCASRQCYIEVVDRNKKGQRIKTAVFYAIMIAVPIIIYFTVFDTISYTKILYSLPVSIISLIMCYVIPIIIAIITFIKVKNKDQKEKNYAKQETQNN